MREARIAAIYREDEGKSCARAHENPAVLELYSTWLGEAGGEKAHHLLHTHYAGKDRV